MLIGSLAALLCLSVIEVASAQVLCSKPIQPLCSMGSQVSPDASVMAQCRDDVRDYKSEFRAFRDCLEAAVENAEREIAKADEFLTCLDEKSDGCKLDADSGL